MLHGVKYTPVTYPKAPTSPVEKPLLSNEVRVKGVWTYLYRAIDCTSDTIDFLLSPKRDAVAAKLFLQLALRNGARIRPRVITVDGHQAYAHAITELKHSGELGKRCKCRRSPYLKTWSNKITVSSESALPPVSGSDLDLWRARSIRSMAMRRCT